jgi:DNA repair protein RecN (Recombination protein N)
MINRLQIKNYAIIEGLDIRFSEGLTIITGETGAGKSILLGALSLIMGDRADTKVLYDDSEKCVVEASFSIADYRLQNFFQENDLDYDDELFIRREITPSGKSRAFINDTPVLLPVLKQLTAALIDLHQQFDTLDINNVDFQLRLIDALADNAARLAGYQESWRHYAADRRKLARLREQNNNAIREAEFLRFQLEEFDKAELAEGEQESLETELRRLSNAEDTKRATSEAYLFLCENESSILAQLGSVSQALQHAGKVDAEVSALHQRLTGLVAELQDIGSELEKVADRTEYNPERIAEVQQRLDLIYRLQKKHGLITVGELLGLEREMRDKLSAFDDLGEQITHLEQSVSTREAGLETMAATLSTRRQEVAPVFTQSAERHLAALAMPAARMEVVFRETPTLTPTGRDDIAFYFSANRGSQPKPIKDVASGGELSRITLVAKSLVASAMALPTLIFDEIDTGVSGDVALRMGAILRTLSNHHQVVAITHSPQVAAKADAHYFIYKVDKDNRTITKLRLLNDEERVKAIATMLSQSPPTDSAIENAKELMALG